MPAGRKTAIVTDSTPYLDPELEAASHLTQVSLYVSLEGRQQREVEVDDFADFYSRLRQSEDGATTSQPSIGDFVAAYTPLLEAGHDIVSIHISANISGTYESAGQARQQLIDAGKGGERIHLYDSRSAAGGLALVLLAAQARAAAGDSPEQVIERARAVRDSLGMWFAVDTLEYLRKGGRIGAARAMLGSALQIKPILTFEEEVTPVDRVRTKRRAFERLVSHASELHERGADAWVVQHVQDAEGAERLVGECRKIFGRDPVFVGEIGPVIGTHAGPGLLGIGGVPAELLS